MNDDRILFSFPHQITSPIKSNSFDNSLQKPLVFNPTEPISYIMNNNIDPINSVVNSTNNAFNGYNLFVLVQHNRFDTGTNSTLLLTNMEGDIITSKPLGAWSEPPGVPTLSARFVNSTTILVGSMSYGATLWNLYENTTTDFEFLGHHDQIYNSINNTVFTFRSYPDYIDGNKYHFDKIEEYNTSGQVVWSLDTQDFISHTQWCPFQDQIQDARDITHSNSLFFDPDENIFYYNARNVNTFYKIDHKTGQVIWGLGEWGDFSMFDRYGNQQDHLFFHPHAVEKVDDYTFLLFDNDYHNQTDSTSKQSRLLEITINETTMTANESWSWIAPPDYFSNAWGDANRLPNGNRLGVFGTRWGWDQVRGPKLVEVTETGQIVWEMEFPTTEKYIYSVYRMERVHLAPILDTPPDIRALSTENVTVQWQTFYNFRTDRPITGSYTLFLDGISLESGSHVFDKFWRPTNLTLYLGRLEGGTHNVTLALADEAGHITTDSLNVSITEFYLEREGPVVAELGQENAFLQWNGDTTGPLLAHLSMNDTLLDSFVWNGSVIALDLNSLELGNYLVTLKLFFDDTNLIYEEQIWVSIVSKTVPHIHSAPLLRQKEWW